MSGRTDRGARAHRQGLAAEARCVWYLRLCGYAILAVRFKTPVGEVDIIARRGRTVAFVEVKSRLDQERAAYAIGAASQARIRNAAAWFLNNRPDLARHNLRIDAMFVTPKKLLPMHVKSGIA